MSKWKALVVLGIAQFLMVLDSAVMNVSISTLVEDFDTEVTVIQGIITLYALVMAAAMITGGKLGDRWGRKRAFTIGMVVYGVGSAITAVSPTVGVLAVGWSILEGLGAALVMPALAALVAGNYVGRDRATAYGVIGGLAGAGIAVGPLLGGWVTTNLTWRLVFAGEVVLVVVVLLLVRWILDVALEGERPDVDWVGAGLNAAGLGLIVFAVIQSSTWGWVNPRNAPFEVLGYAPTLFVIAAGGALLYGFAAWQRHREATGRDPLVRLSLLGIPPLRSGLMTQLAQNLILLGLFFTIPLYLQVVQGLDAFETGLRLLPVSVTMLAASMSGPLLGRFASPRRIIRIGLLVILVAAVLLLGTIQPALDDAAFAWAMAVLGIGMGMLASQLGNVLQSSVGDEARGEVGGLQYTAQQLGSSLGTALIGAVAIGALAAAFLTNVQANPEIAPAAKDAVAIELQDGVSFVPSSQIEAQALANGRDPAALQPLIEDYEEAQLQGLRAGVLIAMGVVLLTFTVTRNLPTRRMADEDDEPTVDLAAG